MGVGVVKLSVSDEQHKLILGFVDESSGALVIANKTSVFIKQAVRSLGELSVSENVILEESVFRAYEYSVFLCFVFNTADIL